jgi:hypothetical protein
VQEDVGEGRDLLLVLEELCEVFGRVVVDGRGDGHGVALGWGLMGWWRWGLHAGLLHAGLLHAWLLHARMLHAGLLQGLLWQCGSHLVRYLQLWHMMLEILQLCGRGLLLLLQRRSQG